MSTRGHDFALIDLHTLLIVWISLFAPRRGGTFSRYTVCMHALRRRTEYTNRLRSVTCYANANNRLVRGQIRSAKVDFESAASDLRGKSLFINAGADERFQITDNT